MKVPNFWQSVAFYVAPLFGLAGIVLSLVALLAPTLFLHNGVSFISIQPAFKADGPNLFMGLLGSCTRRSHNSTMLCTPAGVRPTYDFTFIPAGPVNFFPAPATSWVFVAISIALMTIFFAIFTSITFSHRMGGKINAMVSKPTVQRNTSYIGLTGLMLGMTLISILRIYYGKAVDDFNTSFVPVGDSGLFSASIGNGFYMFVLAYIFFALSIFCSITKINVKASTGKWSV